jgi:hypothetical protein
MQDLKRSPKRGRSEIDSITINKDSGIKIMDSIQAIVNSHI